jgi:hypothetical protein
MLIGTVHHSRGVSTVVLSQLVIVSLLVPTDDLGLYEGLELKSVGHVIGSRKATVVPYF